MARVSVFTVDKRIIKYYLILIDFLHCIELKIGACNIFDKKNVCRQNFSHFLIEKYGKHIVYIDGVTLSLQA